MLIIINNNHIPTPLNDGSEHPLCGHCTLHLRYIGTFGWVHDITPPDYQTYESVRTFTQEIWDELHNEGATITRHGTKQ